METLDNFVTRGLPDADMALEFDRELLACVTGLGGTEQDTGGNLVFQKGEESCMRDLHRMLRRDDQHEGFVSRRLAELGVIRKDLVPLIVAYQDDHDLVYTATKLIVMITMPTPSDAGRLPHIDALKVKDKTAFVESEAMSVFMQMLADPLSRPRKDDEDFGEEETEDSGYRTKDDDALIELVLTLFRNLLDLPPPNGPYGLPLYDAIVASMTEELVLETLIVVSQTINEDETGMSQNWVFLLGEIVYLLLKGHTPAQLFDAIKSIPKRRAPLTMDTDPHDLDPDDSVSVAGDTDRSANRPPPPPIEKKKDRMGIRHPRFGGTYVVTSFTGKQRTVAKPLELTTAVPTDGKRTVAYRKNKAIVSDPQRHDKQVTRALLYDFALQFTASNCYNSLMAAYRYHIDHATMIPASDLSTYFWFSYFFPGFAQLQIGLRSRDDPLYIDMGNVGTTLDMDFVNFIQVKLEECKRTKDWNGHAMAFRAMKSVIMCIETMCKDGPETDKTSPEYLAKLVARGLQSNLFYDPLLFDTLLRVSRDFKQYNQERRHMNDIVETIHVTLKLLEAYTKDKGGKLTVLRKVKKKKKEGEGEEEQMGETTFSDDENAGGIIGGDVYDEDEDFFRESDWDLQGFIIKLAHPSVIANYLYVLSDFKQNPKGLNHMVTKFFHRVAIHCNLAPMFFTIPCFMLFQRVLSYGKGSKDAEMLQLVVLCKHILSLYFSYAKKHAWVYTVPFYPIGRTSVKNMRVAFGEEVPDWVPNTAKAWSEDDDAKLRELHEQYGQMDTARDVIPELIGRGLGTVTRRLTVLGLPPLPKRRALIGMEVEGGYIGVRGAGGQVEVRESDVEVDQEWKQPESVKAVTDKLVNGLVRSRQTQALEWLVDALIDASELKGDTADAPVEPAYKPFGEGLDGILDNENDGDDVPIPVIVQQEKKSVIEVGHFRVLAITPIARRVIKKKALQDVMKAIGFREPTPECGYWRIPGSLTGVYLRDCAIVLGDMIRSAKLKPIRLKKRRKRADSFVSDSDDDISEVPKPRKKRRQGGEKRRKKEEEKEEEKPAEIVYENWYEKPWDLMNAEERERLIIHEETQQTQAAIVSDSVAALDSAAVSDMASGGVVPQTPLMSDVSIDLE